MKKKNDMKTCRACGDKLSTSEFQKNKGAKDGLKSKCKNCRAAEARASRGGDKAKPKLKSKAKPKTKRSTASLGGASKKRLKDTGKLLTRAEEQAQLKEKLG